MGLLKDRVVVIAGVGHGVGRSLALGVARQGGSSVLLARTQATLDAVSAEVAALGGSAVGVQTDLASGESCVSAVEEVRRRFGRVDGYVHIAAASSPYGPIGERTTEEWHRAVDANLRAPVSMIEALTPLLAAQGSGSVVLFGSISARRPYFKSPIYAMMKSAILTLSRLYAENLGPLGVRVNCLLPGWIDTPALQGFFEGLARDAGTTAAEEYRRASSAAYLKRLVTPDEVADVALFLVSDLSRGMSGQALDVNAGQWSN
jgi:NAD(P)-dependent dehydrogenase (short-subunit alcohol dehydrogenase family)